MELVPLDTENNLPFTYQQWAVETGYEKLKTAVLAKPGAGKTRIAIELCRHNGTLGAPDDAPDDDDMFPYGPILVAATSTAIGQWDRQFRLWAGVRSEDLHYVRGTPAQRHRMYDKALKSRRGIYITTWQSMQRDAAIINKVVTYEGTKYPIWGACIGDEYHKVMIRPKMTTKSGKDTIWTAWRKICRPVRCLLMTTGSFVRKSPETMWTIFHLSDHNKFASYHRFMHHFCLMIDTGFGMKPSGPQNLQELRGLMDKHFVYIPEEVIADQLPDGRRYVTDIDPDKEQRQLIRRIYKDMYLDLENNFIVTPGQLGQLIQAKKVLCCPRILDPTLGMGAGFEYILNELQTDPHAIIFVPFRDACDEIQQELKRNKIPCGILRGGTSPQDMARILETFANRRLTLVCTIGFAESWDAETCDRAFFLGYDHAQDVNRQAEGRIQRASSEPEFVTWNYIRYKGTHDEEYIQQLNQDSVYVKRVTDRPQDFINMLKGVLDDE